jgi:polyribonucleotide nucleotidyltransferase
VECSINLFPELHGTSLFQRGETQVLTTAVVGTAALAKKTDQHEVEEQEMLTFPH